MINLKECKRGDRVRFIGGNHSPEMNIHLGKIVTLNRVVPNNHVVTEFDTIALEQFVTLKQCSHNLGYRPEWFESISKGDINKRTSPLVDLKTKKVGDKLICIGITYNDDIDYRLGVIPQMYYNLGKVVTISEIELNPPNGENPYLKIKECYYGCKYIIDWFKEVDEVCFNDGLDIRNERLKNIDDMLANLIKQFNYIERSSGKKINPYLWEYLSEEEFVTLEKITNKIETIKNYSKNLDDLI